MHRLIAICKETVTNLHRHKKMTLWVAVVMLVPIGAIAWANQHPAPPVVGNKELIVEEIQARRLVIVDENGNKHAFFGIMPNGELRLEFVDKTNEPRTWLGVDGIFAPSLSVIGAIKKPLLEFGNIEGKVPVFVMRDATGKRRMAATITPDGAPSLVLSDTRGKTRSTLTISKDGEPMLMLNDKDGKTRGNLMVKANGTCALDFRDKDGHTRITIQVDEDGQPGIAVFDSKEKAIWTAPKQENPRKVGRD